MSARGVLVTGPRSRPNVLAESKRYIPLFWLSFLSSNDVENAANIGQFELDRKRAVERSANSLPFFSALFPQVPSFEAIASSFLGMIGA